MGDSVGNFTVSCISEPPLSSLSSTSRLHAKHVRVTRYVNRVCPTYLHHDRRSSTRSNVVSRENMRMDLRFTFNEFQVLITMYSVSKRRQECSSCGIGILLNCFQRRCFYRPLQNRHSSAGVRLCSRVRCKAPARNCNHIELLCPRV